VSIAWIALIGIVLGVLARLVAPGRKGAFGFLLTGLLGLIGAFGGADLGQVAGWFPADGSAGLAGAAVGAVLVLLLWATLFKSQRASSSI
jgi:uncharacterized membrane protein YeaQ/YmgE (transglycosylase-associated protein family)